MQCFLFVIVQTDLAVFSVLVHKYLTMFNVFCLLVALVLFCFVGGGGGGEGRGKCLHLRLRLRLGFVHPLQVVALHQCLPLSSVCCLPNPGGSLLHCYVVLPSSAWSSS